MIKLRPKCTLQPTPRLKWPRLEIDFMHCKNIIRLRSQLILFYFKLLFVTESTILFDFSKPHI